MKKLPLSKRVQILSMLREGSSKRPITRVMDVTIDTGTKILEDAGRDCIAYHEATARSVASERVQCDGEDAGDMWTWTAIDAARPRWRRGSATVF